jgi:hypothetical protein
VDFRDDRVRHDAVRAELKQMMDFQVKFYADSGAFADDEIVQEGEEGFILQSIMRHHLPSALQGRKTG